MVIRIEEEGSPPEIYFINTAMRKISKKGGKGGRTGEWKRMEGLKNYYHTLWRERAVANYAFS